MTQLYHWWNGMNWMQQITVGYVLIGMAATLYLLFTEPNK